MAVDIDEILKNLGAFYDFSGKTVISVGAGGGQLVDFARSARRVLAVDSDVEAIERLKNALLRKGLSEFFEPVLSDFFDFNRPGDVLIFEFSLHEISDPEKALDHARSLAGDVLVFDHLPESPWAWQVVEEEKVRRSTEAVERAGVRCKAEFMAVQRFGTHEELLAKIRSQGPLALLRAEGYRGLPGFFIPMRYGLSLL